MKNSSNSFIILLLYVDDMLIAGECKREIDKLKGELSKDLERFGCCKTNPWYENYEEQWDVKTVT